MIEYIRGELAALTPAQAVIEAAGVGYALGISLNTYTVLQGKREVKLYVHEAIVTGGRDDSYTLYGFATVQERALYRLLITVSGVGANTARMILSSITPKELCNIIAGGDERMLKSVKGIGALTMLGFSPAPSAKVVQSILTEQPTLPVEQVVKQALKLIK